MRISSDDYSRKGFAMKCFLPPHFVNQSREQPFDDGIKTAFVDGNAFALSCDLNMARINCNIPLSSYYLNSSINSTVCMLKK